MKQVHNNIELGDANECAVICDVRPLTWEAYQRRAWMTSTAPPEFVARDLKTGAKLWDLSAVKEWHEKRPGRGNWGERSVPSKRARLPKFSEPYNTCPTCRKLTKVRLIRRMGHNTEEAVRLFEEEGGLCPQCGPCDETFCAEHMDGDQPCPLREGG